MRRVVSLIVVVAAAALATTAGQAKAGLLNGNCPSTSAYFAANPFDDSSQYYFANNGGFEAGATGWSLSGGAAVTSGNEPWFLSGAGSHALQVPTGGQASTNVCYGFSYPGERFFVNGVGGPATIRVRIYAHSLLGIISLLDSGNVSVPAGWSAPRISSFFSALAAPLGTKSMTVDLTVVNGTAQFDDFFVDPFVTAF